MTTKRTATATRSTATARSFFSAVGQGHNYIGHNYIGALFAPQSARERLKELCTAVQVRRFMEGFDRSEWSALFKGCASEFGPDVTEDSIAQTVDTMIARSAERIELISYGILVMAY